MNLEARTWLIDVQATTALEYFDPVFSVLNFASSGDILFFCDFDLVFLGGVSWLFSARFGRRPLRTTSMFFFSVILTQFSWGECPVISSLGFNVVPAALRTTSIPLVSRMSYVQ